MGERGRGGTENEKKERKGREKSKHKDGIKKKGKKEVGKAVSALWRGIERAMTQSETGGKEWRREKGKGESWGRERERNC